RPTAFKPGCESVCPNLNAVRVAALRDRRELTADRTIITLRSAEASGVEETMAMRLPARVVLVIAFSSLAGVPLSAQLQTGRLLGTVLDEQHAAVPGATVTVTNLATNLARAVTSDGEGNYVVTPLEPG